MKKSLSIACALALGVAITAAAPAAFAQVSPVQIQEAFAQPNGTTLPATLHSAESIELPAGATLEQGVVQLPARSALATADPTPDPVTAETAPTASRLEALTDVAEAHELPAGATVEMGVVQLPLVATPIAADVSTVNTSAAAK